MGFQLAPKLVILNDLERRIVAVILHCFTEFPSFGDNHVTVVEDNPHCL